MNYFIISYQNLILLLYTTIIVIAVADIEFEEIPTSQKAILHEPALIRCVAASKVTKCKWTWKALNSKNTEAYIVREFKAFGLNSRDCSVRFLSLLPEHEGEWTCGILKENMSDFISAPTAVLRVTFGDGIKFSQRPENTEVIEGKSTILKCELQNGTQVERCRWTLKQLNSYQRIHYDEFEPFGNESTDCSVRLRIAQSNHSGEWYCGVKLRGELNYHLTPPAIVTVIRKEMQFVQLSQDLQVAVGETVQLRCVAKTSIHRCRWIWNAFNSTIKKELDEFEPFGNDSRDCSIRFASVLPEQAGEWTCAVKPDNESFYQSAPPAQLNLLPPVKIRFVQVDDDIRIASGSKITLPCFVTAPVQSCRWSWQPLDTNLLIESPQYLSEFKAQGNYSRDCSLNLENIQNEYQGFWTCSVLGTPGIETATSIKLTVYDPVRIDFSEITQAIQMPIGSPVLLRCVTTQKVAKCRWFKVNTNETFSEFLPIGQDKNDCSMRINSVNIQHSGEWICGVKYLEMDIYQNAPISVLTVIPDNSTSEILPLNYTTKNITI